MDPRGDATGAKDEGGAGRLAGAALRVASFNIRNGRAFDGRDSWPFRARACAAAIRLLRADVVGLQEAYGFQLCSLRRRLHGFAATGAGRDDGRRRGERCSVLFRLARLELQASRTRWLSDTPDVPGSRTWGNPIPRVATVCRFRDRQSGRSFGVVGTHWDGASALSRERSAEALLDWLDLAEPWVVLGDLNATASDPGVARLNAAGFVDTLAHLGERGRGVATHHSWDGATWGTRIDYVLVSPHWDVLSSGIEHTRPEGRLPSDHWPVIAEIRLRDAGEAR